MYRYKCNNLFNRKSKKALLLSYSTFVLLIDIDECSLFPCGSKEKNSCTNFVGYYKCSCGVGFIADITERECIGM